VLVVAYIGREVYKHRKNIRRGAELPKAPHRCGVTDGLLGGVAGVERSVAFAPRSMEKPRPPHGKKAPACRRWSTKPRRAPGAVGRFWGDDRVAGPLWRLHRERAGGFGR
jgi:hypothetical protein